MYVSTSNIIQNTYNFFISKFLIIIFNLEINFLLNKIREINEIYMLSINIYRKINVQSKRKMARYFETSSN